LNKAPGPDCISAEHLLYAGESLRFFLSELFHMCIVHGYTPVLNMIRSPDRDPTGFCTSEPEPDWTGFWKKLNRIRYGYPNCIDHCSKMLNQRVFFGYKPDWIKYFDKSTEL